VPYLLDTDTITALQRNHPVVVARIRAVPPSELFVCVVSLEEQIAGRLQILHRASRSGPLVEAYWRPEQTSRFYSTVQVLPFDLAAASRDEQLRHVYRRMGTKDRRVASIALVRRCTLVTRNTVHFLGIAGLPIENWIDASS
jgi:tRNA(fMet)-specific endonuclease VapC